MVEITSEDYHDFVIKGGKLIGEFEQMYIKSKETPWHQDKQENWMDVRLTIEMLKDYGKFDSICDFGSGLGYYLDILKRKTGSKKCNAIGLDVSPTCCVKAKDLFPDYNFYPYNLMGDNSLDLKNEMKGNKLFVTRATLWYVFPKIEKVVENIAKNIERNELLLVVQNFMPLNSAFVGKEVIPNPEALVEWFNKDFTLIKSVWFENKESAGNDNWFISLFRKK